MQMKAKLILLMAAMCILTATALAQGGAREGPNGGPDREMWQAGENSMMFGSNNQNEGPVNGQPPAPPRFKGCNTDPQKMPPKEPIKPPADKPDGSENGLGPEDAPHDGRAPWTYNERGDGKHEGPFFGFAGHDGHVPPRCIMGADHQQVPPQRPKKSMMDKKHHRVHKGPLKPLNPEDLPELPPMKSIMDHGS